MTRERPPVLVPATPEYVLALLRAWHRREAASCDADRDFVVTPEATIDDWDWAMLPHSPPERIGRSLGVDRAESEWAAVADPAGERTLGDLCAFLADSGAVRPAFEPIGFLGARPCAAAGAFAAVRSILREAGADADAITPSTPLEPYLRRHLEAFVHPPLAFLAPGALPEPRARSYRPLLTLVGVCFAVMAATPPAMLAGIHWLEMPTSFAVRLTGVALAALAILLVAILAASLLDRHRHLTTYTLGDLRTFKDLARALAAGVEWS